MAFCIPSGPRKIGNKILFFFFCFHITIHFFFLRPLFLDQKLLFYTHTLMSFFITTKRNKNRICSLVYHQRVIFSCILHAINETLCCCHRRCTRSGGDNEHMTGSNVLRWSLIVRQSKNNTSLRFSMTSPRVTTNKYVLRFEICKTKQRNPDLKARIDLFNVRTNVLSTTY